MIKYQEALNFLCEHAMEWRDDYDWNENPIGEYVPMNEYELKEHREPLQELIDKELSKAKQIRKYKKQIRLLKRRNRNAQEYIKKMKREKNG